MYNIYIYVWFITHNHLINGYIYNYIYMGINHPIPTSLGSSIPALDSPRGGGGQ
jgi:hypothetical protein